MRSRNLFKSVIAVAASLLLGACAFSESSAPVTGMSVATLPPATQTTMPTTEPTAAVSTAVTTSATTTESQTTAPTTVQTPRSTETTTPPATTVPPTETTTSQTTPATTTPKPTTPQTTATTTTTTPPVTTTAKPTTTPPPTTAAPKPTTPPPTTTPLPATTTPPPTTAPMTMESIGFGVTPITVPSPHTGGEVYGNEQATIDATDKAEGYVLVKYTGTPGTRIKVLITGPSGVQYTYNLNDGGRFEVFPFSDGNGSYAIGIYRNTEGNKYATVWKSTLSVTMKDAYAAFLHPNQYVNYHSKSKVLQIAAEQTAGLTDTLAKVEAVYRYVTGTITYDYALAANVQSGYLPDVDAVIAKRSGICFDYAAVMTAMLRGLGIPTKLVVGYCGTEYHAWINVHVEGKGWVNSVVYFDGSAWNHMDPTYAASRPDVGDFSARYTYTEKYVY